jgi:hypothetical protein
MKMRRFKGLLVAAVLTVFSASLFAADATVTFVSGKVEVQRNGKWVALQKGDTVAKSETISTGFQSEAKIKMMDSVMYLGPVTRITLEELSTTGKQDNVNVYLKTGSARSQVKHVDNKRVNYQVHTAVAVASCRGTDWIIDDSNNIICFEGIVAVAAYIPPENYIDNKSGSGKKEESEGESEGSEESTEETPAVADAGAESESSVETKETTALVTETPTTNDGILVKANQSVTVSITSEVSVPINTVVTTVSNVTSAVKTASEKEAVATVETNETPSVIASEDSKSQVTTGTVVVNIEFDE